MLRCENSWNLSWYTLILGAYNWFVGYKAVQVVGLSLLASTLVLCESSYFRSLWMLCFH